MSTSSSHPVRTVAAVAAAFLSVASCGPASEEGGEVAAIGAQQSALQAASSKSWTVGEIVFPGIGAVSAERACFDAATQQYRYTRRASGSRECVSGTWDYSRNYREPEFVCTQWKTVEVPGGTFVAGPTYQKEICAQYDYSRDYRNPQCVATEVVTKQQPRFYDLYTCQPWDYRCDRPAVKRMPVAACR
jgi:hypothetical protein